MIRVLIHPATSSVQSACSNYSSCINNLVLIKKWIGFSYCDFFVCFLSFPVSITPLLCCPEGVIHLTELRTETEKLAVKYVFTVDWWKQVGLNVY